MEPQVNNVSKRQYKLKGKKEKKSNIPALGWAWLHCMRLHCTASHWTASYYCGWSSRWVGGSGRRSSVPPPRCRREPGTRTPAAAQLFRGGSAVPRRQRRRLRNHRCSVTCRSAWSGGRKAGIWAACAEAGAGAGPAAGSTAGGSQY